jgi:hypothetical protein
MRFPRVTTDHRRLIAASASRSRYIPSFSRTINSRTRSAGSAIRFSSYFCRSVAAGTKCPSAFNADQKPNNFSGCVPPRLRTQILHLRQNRSAGGAAQKFCGSRQRSKFRSLHVPFDEIHMSATEPPQFISGLAHRHRDRCRSFRNRRRPQGGCIHPDRSAPDRVPRCPRAVPGSRAAPPRSFRRWNVTVSSIIIT